MSTKQTENKKNTETKKKTVQKVEPKIEESVVDSGKKKKRIIAILLAVFIVIIIGLIVLASYFRNFGEISLLKNDRNIFDTTDLVINDLKFSDNEKTVLNSLGKPEKEDKEVIDNYEYKVLKYDGLTVYLKEYYDDYVLSKVEITSSKYSTSRDIKVGSKITNVFAKYKVENSEGAYMYGNYTNKALTEKEITSNIYYGVRSNENVLFVNRDAVVEGLPTNIAKLDIIYKNGTITKITWSYDIK